MSALVAAWRKGVATKKAAKPAKTTKPAKPTKAAAKSSEPPTLQSRLAKLGLRRDFDLVLHLPLRYEDETRLATIADASSAQSAEPVQVQGRVVRTEVMYRPRRQLVSRIEDGSGVLVLRFFN